MKNPFTKINVASVWIMTVFLCGLSMTETYVAQTAPTSPKAVTPTPPPTPAGKNQYFDFSDLIKKGPLELPPLKSKGPLDFSFDKLSDSKTESEIKIVLDKYTKLVKENPSSVSDIYLARAHFFSGLVDYNRTMADLVRYTNSLQYYDFPNARLIATQFQALGMNTSFVDLEFLSGKSTARDYLEKSMSWAQNPRSFDEALDAAAGALKRNPSLTEAHLVRGKILIQKGKTDEGVAEANAALEQETDNVGALCIRAMGYAMKNDFPHALDDLNRATALDPELASLYNAFGVRNQIYMAEGKTDLAAADLKKAQQLAKIVGGIQQMN